MYLTKLEIQGFKTFAKKTTLQFLGPKKDSHPVTSIVGPNGSGKSNLADAIRWVLGEQSLKLLRGKKSEDVIFSGAQGKARAGFAEVILTFNNEDKMMPVDFAEVAITRRLYRDGKSEYLINDTQSKLSEIKLLLAQANVGERSYSVVGQGMVDHILVSSPEERKAFFDDATGVKQFQLKRHEAMLKLKRTYENLSEVEMILNEISPRLKSLKRQVSRLEKRDEVETELIEKEKQYYGTLWWKLADELQEVKTNFDKIDGQVKAEEADLLLLEKKVSDMETDEKSKEEKDHGLLTLQKEHYELQKKRSKIRDDHFQTQKEIELAKVRAQSNWAPLPLLKIIEELNGIENKQAELLKKVKSIKDLKELDKLHIEIDTVLGKTKKLVSRLQRPAPEDIKTDPKLIAKLKELENAQKEVEKELSESENKMQSYVVKEKKVRTELFDLQRDLRSKQQQIHNLENNRNKINIELARLEERRQNLIREIEEHLGGKIEDNGKDLALHIQTNRLHEFVSTNELYPEIQRLRYKLELIGGIDPEIVAEYNEIKERHDFLSEQTEDLQKAIKTTEKVIDELDEKIHKQSEKAFSNINKEFQKFFKILFGGGSCSLVKMTKKDVDEQVEISPERVSEDTAEKERERHEEDTDIEAIKKRIKEREDRVIGIDINATPPGKKLKDLNLLSGGERALTSIALISAIMAVNPSPFVVLDEVDAALDEANTVRFAAILDELRKLTQFIIVTHNRATMERADILYGVTMGDDGISNLLSVRLEDIQETETARR